MGPRYRRVDLCRQSLGHISAMPVTARSLLLGSSKSQGGRGQFFPSRVVCIVWYEAALPAYCKYYATCDLVFKCCRSKTWSTRDCRSMPPSSAPPPIDWPSGFCVGSALGFGAFGSVWMRLRALALQVVLSARHEFVDRHASRSFEIGKQEQTSNPWINHNRKQWTCLGSRPKNTADITRHNCQ